MTSAVVAHAPAERVRTQTARAVQTLRGLILAGQIRSGERLSETDMVARLGVSRTPARMAMIRLHEEGLLEEVASSGGFRVRGFGPDEVGAAIEIRGILEALAARLAAERRPPAADLDALRAGAAAMDDVVRHGTSPARIAAYAAQDNHFHTLLGRLAGSPALARQLERAAAPPFAAPGALLPAQAKVLDLATVLVVAQDQHRCLVDAIAEGDGARAEALAREHARLAIRGLDRILRDHDARQLVPGHALIAETDA